MRNTSAPLAAATAFCSAAIFPSTRHIGTICPVPASWKRAKDVASPFFSEGRKNWTRALLRSPTRKSSTAPWKKPSLGGTTGLPELGRRVPLPKRPLDPRLCSKAFPTPQPGPSQQRPPPPSPRPWAEQETGTTVSPGSEIPHSRFDRWWNSVMTMKRTVFGVLWNEAPPAMPTKSRCFSAWEANDGFRRWKLSLWRATGALHRSV